ncbi:GAF domain-like protein [Viridothelium virens]|uniref:GAF domain-like protein n=1 Tax=Viridothelium virens TaxID=1048519 RepID=A0A6A6H1G5_VIRVR|nr:GAF domain-like protein [Viridothelium virens]
MVHAEASNFAEGISKTQAYAQVLEQATALFEDQRNWICNLANASSLIYHALKSLPTPSNRVNWAGFYVCSPNDPSELILGPFQGKVACQTIAFGKGVCGTAAALKKTQLVPDVENFAGHIACDSESQSEIVVPIMKDDNVVGIIDIDCAEKNGFGEDDQTALEELARLLVRSCDF